MIAHLLWQTPSDHPLPAPSARLALIADHDGRPDSYGVSLEVTDLPRPPSEYAATITVTAGNGQSLTFAATPSTEVCVGEGGIYFNGPDEKGKQAAALGDFPFTTTVELTLDGVTYVGTSAYPDDEIENYGPFAALRFDPPLPR